MPVIIFFVNLVLLYYVSILRLGGNSRFFTNIREGFIHSSIFISCFIFIQIYFLSTINAINFTGILITNLILTGFLLYKAVALRKKASLFPVLVQVKKKYIFAMVFFFLIFIIPLLYLCIIVPPNNTDANTCYLIRVEYWIKNFNIHHFPTQNLFELYYNQFPQFLMLNTRILSGSDYFASIFQFFAYIGSIFTVSLITRELGGKNPKTQLISAIICLSIPQAILQSTAAMYDLQSAFAASVAVLYFIRLVRNPEENFLRNSILFSIAFAFTSYIKYSSLFFILFFPAFITLYYIRKSLKRCIQFVSIITGIFLIIHVPFFIENYRSFGNPVSAKTSESKKDNLINERCDIGSITSGIVKNVAINIVTPMPYLNEKLYSAVVKFHKIIRTEINDPEINLNEFYEKFSAAISESTSGNMNTMTLILIALTLLISRFVKNIKSGRVFYDYLLCLVLGFLVFTTIFKFQSWNARLQLPFFVISVAPVSILLSDIFLRWKISYRLIIIFCFITAVPFVYFNYGKPIVSYRAIRMLFNKPPAMINFEDFRRFEEQNPNIKNYYSIENSSSFYHLNAGMSNSIKKNVFAWLDSVNYFSNEISILSKTRNQSYLVPRYENSGRLLTDFEQTLDYLSNSGNKNLNIGLVLGRSPEYPLLAMMRDSHSETKINWQHIEYYTIMNENRNFKGEFFYGKIVTNDSLFLIKVKSPIASVKQFGSMFVANLQAPDSTKYRIE